MAGTFGDKRNEDVRDMATLIISLAQHDSDWLDHNVSLTPVASGDGPTLHADKNHVCWTRGDYAN